jgi:hypothetical protein
MISQFHFRGRIPPYYLLKIQAYECIRAVDATLEMLRSEYPAGYAGAMRDQQTFINVGAIEGEKNHPEWSGTPDEPKYFPRSALDE